MCKMHLLASFGFEVSLGFHLPGHLLSCRSKPAGHRDLQGKEGRGGPEIFHVGDFLFRKSASETGLSDAHVM